MEFLINECDGFRFVAGQLVVADRLKEIAVDCSQGVEGRKGVLEDRLYVLGKPHLFVLRFRVLLALMNNGAGRWFLKT